MHLIIYLCFTVIVLFLLLYFARLLAGRCPRYSALHAYNRGAKSDFSVCIVLGSGGHTTEILRIVSNLGPRYSKRHYILADTDTTSLCKMHACEKMRRNSNENEVELYDFHFIPRSREVGQSYFGSIFTTLWSLYKILSIVFASDYDLLLCNGPGTCVPVCAAVVLKDILTLKVWRRFTPIIFIESICRVESLSLSGKILYFSGLADVIFVQWSNLTKKYSRIKYLGRF